ADENIAKFEKAYKKAEELNQGELMGRALYNIGLEKNKMGKAREAAEYFFRAAIVFYKEHDTDGLRRAAKSLKEAITAIPEEEGRKEAKEMAKKAEEWLQAEQNN
uniref:Designed Protein DA05R1 n=1 Tax=synthetic construct TaxID=32630 RepID=UPI000718AB87|nr:Chain A, Designed Protein DA05R1 [synthetic construct]